MEQYRWDLEIAFPHVFRLFSTVVSTKEVLEDLFGYLSQRNKTDVSGSTRMSVERAFFLSTMNPRWKTDAWPAVQTQEGDLQSAKATNFLRGRQVYLPSSKHQASATKTRLKEIVDSGPTFRSAEVFLFTKRIFCKANFLLVGLSDAFSLASCCGPGRKKMPGMQLNPPALRPAGHLSDFRMVAAMMSLRHLERQDFKDIGAAWLGELFEEGHLYRNAVTGLPAVCLGFHYKVAFMWEVQEIEQGFFKLAEGADFGSMTDVQNNFDTVCLTQIEKKEAEAEGSWMAVPTRVCCLSELFRIRVLLRQQNFTGLQQQ